MPNATDRDPCGQFQPQLLSDEGTFTSPNYPQNYGVELECSWIISATSGHVVELEINDFETEVR